MQQSPRWFNNGHSRGMFNMSKDAYETSFNAVINDVVDNYGLLDVYLAGAMDTFLPGTKQDIDKAISEF